MRCPSCDHDNRAERRFCAECGAALATICPACGASHEPGEKFYGGCYERLRPGAAAPGAAATATTTSILRPRESDGTASIRAYRDEVLEARYKRLRELGQAVDWKGGSFESFDLRPFLEEVLPTLTFSVPHPRALEYGTGTGPGACYLAARGFEVDAIDVSPTAIELARRFASERALRIRFWVEDITALSVREPAYDLIVDNFCFHNLVTDRERTEALGRVRTALKADGYFLMGCSVFRRNRDYGVDFRDARTGIVYHPVGSRYQHALWRRAQWYVPVRRHPTAEVLCAELENAGFGIIRRAAGRLVCRVME